MGASPSRQPLQPEAIGAVSGQGDQPPVGHAALSSARAAACLTLIVAWHRSPHCAVHCAAGSDGEMNFGLTSLAALKAASSRVARYSLTVRLAATSMPQSGRRPPHHSLRSFSASGPTFAYW